MIINFALSLSVEGIELLHRVPRGWRRIGRADVASDTLDAELAALRDKAQAIAPDGVRTKLIIPLDQIKYTAIDSTQTTQDDIDAILEGATPYALDELVIDCERFGGRTHIAAVARETLQEAEAFASAHGYNPVAFVAVPEPFTFQKEVFFGPTTMMPDILGSDAVVARDDLPVMVVGTRIKSRLLVFGLPQEIEEEAQRNDLADLLSPQPKQDITAQDDGVAQPEPVATDAPAPPDDTSLPIQQIWVDHIPSEYHAPVAITEVVETPEPITPLIPENPILAKPAVLDPIIAEYHAGKVAADKAPLVAVANTGSTKAPKLGAVTPAANRKATPVVAANKNKTPLVAAGIAATVLLFGGLIWSQQDAPDVTAVPSSAPIVSTQSPTQLPLPEAPVTTASASLEAGPQTPELAVTGFGIADTDGDAIPVVASDTAPTVLAVPESLRAAAADPLPLPPQAPPPAPEPQTAQATVGSPILRGQVLSPAEANRIYQATGVWQRAPRFLDVPNGVIEFNFDRPNTTTPPEKVAQPQVPAAGGLETDLSFIAPANPPPPDVRFPRDEDGFILATPQGTVTPEGAVVIAGLPDLSITPRPTLTESDLNRMALLAPAPEGVIIIAGRPDPVPPLRPANAQLPVPTQAPLEATADLEPPLAPTLSPGSVGLAALELQNSGAVALDSNVVEDNAVLDLRPRLRPQGLLPSDDPRTPDITEIIAGIETEDATLRFDNSTSLAVVLSPRPDTRPSNFSNVVAAARAQLQTRQAVAAAPAPVTAAAPVPPQNFEPVPGGVARAATQEDAIRLREINLIGVYGRPNARRALVRLNNGRFVRVEVGSALDGGQVTAIGDRALNYVKRGRTYAIELP